MLMSRKLVGSFPAAKSSGGVALCGWFCEVRQVARGSDADAYVYERACRLKRDMGAVDEAYVNKNGGAYELMKGDCEQCTAESGKCKVPPSGNPLGLIEHKSSGF